MVWRRRSGPKPAVARDIHPGSVRDRAVDVRRSHLRPNGAGTLSLVLGHGNTELEPVEIPEVEHPHAPREIGRLIEERPRPAGRLDPCRGRVNVALRGELNRAPLAYEAWHCRSDCEAGYKKIRPVPVRCPKCGGSVREDR